MQKATETAHMRSKHWHKRVWSGALWSLQPTHETQGERISQNQHVQNFGNESRAFNNLVFIQEKLPSVLETRKLWGSATYFSFILQFRSIEKYQPTLLTPMGTSNQRVIINEPTECYRLTAPHFRVVYLFFFSFGHQVKEKLRASDRLDKYYTTKFANGLPTPGFWQGQSCYIA